MVEIIAADMPVGDPSRCVDDCPSLTARYILSALQAPQLPACTAASLPARSLRLLTRREYRNTVAAVFTPPPRACTPTLPCALVGQSCTAGTCTKDACNVVTFAYRPAGSTPQTVVVAGSFNNWAATAAEGAWPMTYSAVHQAFFIKHQVADGNHTYKFVVDGNTWVPDPENGNTVPDGFGGINSVLVQDCAGAPAGGTPALTSLLDQVSSRFPPEVRPVTYPFDNNAAAAAVTPVHVDEYLLAARALASLAVSDLDGLMGCTAGMGPDTCAQSFVRRAGFAAWRRPLSNAEASECADLIVGATSLSEGVSICLQLLLMSPHFLYRSEVGTAQADGSWQLDGYEIASALSYLFWGGPPDEALMADAANGVLLTAEGRAQHARRLLADPAATQMLGTWGMQWLGTENVVEAEKNAVLYPGFTPAVRQALAEETRRFFTHVLLQSTGTLQELLTATYTFANDPLASHYGFAGTGSSQWMQVNLPAERAGLLGHGSVLATTSHADQTSPVRRGLMVRRRLLCQEFGVPPANAGMVPEVDPNATTRDRFGQHSQAPNCRSCHRFIDPVGFGFEQFDAVGRFRTVENGLTIDASGSMDDVNGLGTGTFAPFATLPQLGVLIAQSQGAQTCAVKQAWRFMTGTLEGPQDRCAIETYTAALADAGGNLRELLVTMVSSDAFIRRRP